MSPARPLAALFLGALLGAAAGTSVAAPTAVDLDARIAEIRSFVREQRYPLALESLRLLARSIQELRLDEVRPAFPDAPPGWSATELFSLAADEEPWTRRIEARRDYRRGDGAARISVTVDLHSPLIPAVSLAFNPVFVAADPLARRTEVAGEQALLRFSADSGDADLRVLLGSGALVTLTGRGLSSGEELLSLARGIDFDLLRTRVAR